MADDWMYFLQTSSCRHTFQTLFFFCYPLASDAKHSKVFVTQSCPTLCISIDCSPPGSTVHRILQARTLEWGAIAFSGMTRLAKYKEPFTWKQIPGFELQLCSQLAKTSYFICLTLSFLVMKAKELGAKLKTLLVLKMYEALILILNPGFSNT